MKKISFYAWLIVLLIVAITESCKKDDDVFWPVELNVGANLLNFGSVGSQKAVLTKASYAWTANMVNMDDSVWCKLRITPDSLYVNVTPNLDTLERIGRIRIVSQNEQESKEAFIDVIQSRGAKAGMLFSPAEAVFTALNPEIVRVEIISNTQPITWSWGAEGVVEWMEEPVLEGNILTLAVQENSGNSTRNAGLVIKCGPEGNQAVDTLRIQQMTQGHFIKFVGVTNDTIFMDTQGSAVRAEVMFNVPAVSYSLNPLTPFEVREVEKTATKVVYEITANEPNTSLNALADDFFVTYENSNPNHPGFDDNRTEDITVRSKVVIFQAGMPKAEIRLGQKSVKLPRDGQTQLVAVNSSFADWSCESDAGWCQVSKTEDGKLAVTAPVNEGEYRSAKVTITCGIQGNSAKAVLEVIQSGINPVIILDKKEVVLDEFGTEQKVFVTSDVEDWSVDASDSWIKIEVNREEGSFTVKADPLEGGARGGAVRVSAFTTDNQEIQALLVVSQRKGYEVGDLYKVDGKVVGIVYEIWDNGMHGRVMSLKGNTGQLDGVLFSLDLYAWDGNSRDQYPFDAIATSMTDGRENMEAFKHRTFTDGKDWKYHYPAAAWVEQFDADNGSLGWYFPAYKEIISMMTFLNGTVMEEGSDPTDEISANRNRINKLITDNGGEEFIFDSYTPSAGYDDRLGYLASSTEYRMSESGSSYVMFQRIHTNYNTPMKFHAAGHIDDFMTAVGQLRPILQF